MKHINTLIAFFLVANCSAQVYYEILTDGVVAASKTAIIPALAAEVGLREKQKDLLIDLRKLEDEYSDKRNPISNTATVGVVLALEYTFDDIQSKIDDIKHNMTIFKFASLGMHGLGRYGSQLEKENKYLNKLKEERDILRAGLLFSGSPGDNYTVFLKLWIKLIPIKNRVLKIDKEIKARMRITRILAR